MIVAPDKKLTRIGVFYDGGYFSAVSDYYRYYHSRKRRLAVDGIHHFVKHKVAEVEGVDQTYCQVVDAHYFRGRFSALETQEHGKLFADRAFDDALMRAGVTTHYLPRSPSGEKGVDVWFALEAYELALNKRFNVLVLTACDGDYLPLIRKLNSLGIRVMLLAWDFSYVDRHGRPQGTRTAQVLLNEVTYPVAMHTLIDDRSLRRDPVVDGLFVPLPEDDLEPQGPHTAMKPVAIDETRTGAVKNIPEGKTFGFIADEDPEPQDWFFNASNVTAPGFAELATGDRVRFKIAENPRGGMWAIDVARID